MERVQGLLVEVSEGAAKAGVFGSVSVEGTRVVCRAKASAAPASYCVDQDGPDVYVSLLMGDRWLSQSIEADLVNTGDAMEDLLDEELAELGVTHEGCEMGVPGGIRLMVEHYRSEEKLFTFRSKLPGGVARLTSETILGCLLAYEACFRRLGDMEADDEE